MERTRCTPAYQLELTNREVEDLGWASDKGYWPIEAYDDLSLADGEPEDVGPDVPRVWELGEPAAREILSLSEDDSEAYLTCLGGSLLSKLLKLEGEIV